MVPADWPPTRDERAAAKMRDAAFVLLLRAWLLQKRVERVQRDDRSQPNVIAFERVELVARDLLGFRCRVGSRLVWIGNLQWAPGTNVHVLGDRLVLRRDDAAELGLVDGKPA